MNKKKDKEVYIRFIKWQLSKMKDNTLNLKEQCEFSFDDGYVIIINRFVLEIDDYANKFYIWLDEIDEKGSLENTFELSDFSQNEIEKIYNIFKKSNDSLKPKLIAYHYHGDYVHCNYCNTTMVVEYGSDVCPNCGMDGCMEWVDEEHQEVEIERDGFLKEKYEITYK